MQSSVSDPAPRVLVIGLDGAAPELVFDAWRNDLPVLDELMRSGVHGPLESTIPAITVPAWSSMMTGRDPGQLGIYGFRNRLDWSYDRLGIATGRDVAYPRVWERLSEHGRHVATVAVPQTYPVKPINGDVVGCFLTPSARSEYTYPAALKREIEGWVDGEFLVDVPNFRSEDKDATLANIYRLADQHFEVCRRLLGRATYDYFMLVDMGVDRVHHAFWKFMDPRHPRYQPGHRFASAIHDYYVHVDSLIGGLLELVPDDTVVLVVSDHGGQAMMGGYAINEWLRDDGYLTVGDYPDTLATLDRCAVDWSGTAAWGDGGYYGRLFMNVGGREPSGTIPGDTYEAFRTRLIEEIGDLPDHLGRPLGSRAYRPQDLYREVRGFPPDLVVYFGDLTWRSVGKLGLGSRWTFENDTGPDDANHSQHGIFIMRGGGLPAGERLDGLRIHDVAPTLLTMFGLEYDEAARGRPMNLSPVSTTA
jgi:predicted AlkP superfamily phosphohydrolase/phosphomutase